ncbi:MAG: Peptide deformylase [Solimicrobium sp.]|jgi:peptide deformylase|nr:Peptide deformylase [Solimicrobium sp.]
MTIREILKMGDPRLLKTAQPVSSQMFGSQELKQLIEDMLDTMRANDGVGLAAPQIGVDLQVVLFGFDESERYPDNLAIPQTVLINPVIKPLDSNLEEGWEGCLSVPGLRGMVPRWARIRYEGVDVDGVLIVREVDDFHARVVQHECDHLYGTLYPMRIKDFSHFGFVDALFAEQAEAKSIPLE